MSNRYDSLRVLLLDVEKFLMVTLKDVPLPGIAKDERNGILGRVDELRKEFPGLLMVNGNVQKDAATVYDSGQKKSPKSAAPAAKSSSGDDLLIYDGLGEKTVMTPVAVSELENADKEGYLLKKKSADAKMKLFANQKRWCMLKGDTLYYFVKHTDAQQRNQITLTDYESRPLTDVVQKKDQFGFQLVCPGKRTFEFIATSGEERQEWLDVLNRASGYHSRPTAGDSDSGSLYEDCDAYTSSPKPAPNVVTNGRVPDPAAEDEEDIYEDTGELGPEEEEIYDDTEGLQEEIYDDTEGLQEEGEIYDDTEEAPTKDDSDTDSQEVYDEIEPDYRPPVDITRQQKGRYEHKEVKSIMPPSRPPKPASNNTENKHIVANLQAELSQLKLKPPPEPKGVHQPQIGTQKYVEDQSQSLTQRNVEDYENMYYGKWNYSGKRDDELSFRCGDIVLITNRDYDHFAWWVGELNGQTGMVPKDFMTPVYKGV